MHAGFVLLTNSTASDKVIDKDREARPPEVALHNSLGAEMAKVTREGGRMDGMQERRASRGWNMQWCL